MYKLIRKHPAKGWVTLKKGDLSTVTSAMKHQMELMQQQGERILNPNINSGLVVGDTTVLVIRPDDSTAKRGVIGVTGHRPPGLFRFEAYGHRSKDFIDRFAYAVLDEYKPKLVYTGMALGWDQAVARMCVSMGIDFVAMCPCPGYESKWPQESRTEYNHLLRKAVDVHYSHTDYRPSSNEQRNRDLVDRVSLLLALLNPAAERSGTASCVNYAKKQKVSVTNLWPAWLDFARDHHFPVIGR